MVIGASMALLGAAAAWQLLEGKRAKPDLEVVRAGC
jgi:hypothetical protein